MQCLSMEKNGRQHDEDLASSQIRGFNLVTLWNINQVIFKLSDVTSINYTQNARRSLDNVGVERSILEAQKNTTHTLHIL